MSVTTTDTPGSVAAPGFWSDVLERCLRQAQQTALPIAAVLTAGGGFDPGSAALTIATAVALTLLKNLLRIQASDASPLLLRLADRVVPAVAGVLVGFIPVDYLGWASVDYRAAGLASLGAALTALLTAYGAPPEVPTRRALFTVIRGGGRGPDAPQDGEGYRAA